MVRINCPSCKKEGKFRLFFNVYSKQVMKQDHYEIVCDNCNYGIVAIPYDLKKIKIKGFDY